MEPKKMTLLSPESRVRSILNINVKEVLGSKRFLIDVQNVSRRGDEKGLRVGWPALSVLLG